MIRDRGTSIRMPVINVFNLQIDRRAVGYIFKPKITHTNRYDLSLPTDSRSHFNDRRRPLNPDAKTIFTETFKFTKPLSGSDCFDF
jgi:hypothetical protein